MSELGHVWMPPLMQGFSEPFWRAACTIVVRCRYRANLPTLRKAGATFIVSEEAEASVALMRFLERMD